MLRVCVCVSGGGTNLQAIMDAIERLHGRKTLVIIAHRLTTIQNAKRILVLTEEGIAEEGGHEDLLAKKGVYEKMYHMHNG